MVKQKFPSHGKNMKIDIAIHQKGGKKGMIENFINYLIISSSSFFFLFSFLSLSDLNCPFSLWLSLSQLPTQRPQNHKGQKKVRIRE